MSNNVSKWMFVAIAAALICPSAAEAGNMAHPRTPVDWSGAPCMTVVDRSVGGSIYQLSYAVPYEDTDVTADEVANSRTHQFFAFCRDRHLEDILPGWVSEADVQAAVAKGLGDLEFVDLELDVLDNAPDWAGCWMRINQDDERRPITFAAAAEPVPWDTTMLPAGAYVVDGYTYEPWYNIWSPHPGVFKLVDDPDPAATGPAAALSFAEQTVVVGEAAVISGCVDVMPGATMDLWWSNGNVNGEPNWVEFAGGVEAQTGSFELDFVAPIEAAGNSVMIRLDISDPMGRSWTAYSRSYVAVVEDVGGEDGCDSSGGFVGDPCGTDTGGTSTSGETGPGATDGGGSCSCSSAPAGQGLAGLLGLVLLVLCGITLPTRERDR